MLSSGPRTQYHALITDGEMVPVMENMALVKLDPRGERQHEKGQCL